MLETREYGRVRVDILIPAMLAMFVQRGKKHEKI